MTDPQKRVRSRVATPRALRDYSDTIHLTPERHQRRGAGRALLTHALAAEWRDDTELAVLIATPAGRRLYESIGFEASDELLTRFRGLDDELLAAIGQPG